MRAARFHYAMMGLKFLAQLASQVPGGHDHPAEGIEK